MKCFCGYLFRLTDPLRIKHVLTFLTSLSHFANGGALVFLANGSYPGIRVDVNRKER